MTRTVISYGNSRLIALPCASGQDLGNISRCFYNEFQTLDRCPYAAQHQAPRLQMLMIIDKREPREPEPKPCRIHAVNGGWSLPFKPEDDVHCYESNKHNACSSPDGERKLEPRKAYYYDFAIVGECDDLEFCLDTFLKQMGLAEVRKSSYMSEHELYSFMKQYLEQF